MIDYNLKCKLCDGEKIYPNKDTSFELYENALVVESGLEGYGPLSGFDLEIRYCPMCGEDLDENK